MSLDVLSGSVTATRTRPAAASRSAAATLHAPSSPHRAATWHVQSPTLPADRALRPPISLEIVSGILRGWDAVVALSAGLTALVLAAPDLPMPASYYVALSFFGTLVAINTLHLAGAYDTGRLRRGRTGLLRILLAWSVTAIVMALAMVVSDAAPAENLSWLVLWFVIGLFLPAVARFALMLRIEYWRQAGRLRRRVAVLGAGPDGQALLRRFAESTASAEADAVLVGLYDERIASAPTGWRGHAVRGNCEDLLDDIRRQRIDAVVVATPFRAGRQLDGLLNRLRCVAVDVCLCPDPYGLRLAEGVSEYICDIPLLTVERRPYRDWHGVAKMLEDRLFAAAVLLLIAPLLTVIAIAIRIDSPGPVLFKQKRYGRNNQLIEVLKFRTMYHHARDPNAEQLTRRNDPRVTRLGAFLRRTSLDELPQFINVLRGEMSVVGPRPHALMSKAGGVLYHEAVENYHWRHRVKPGITGWAQVNGWRGETETLEQIRKRVEHDIYYIQNWSLLLDAQIILRTIFGGFTGHKAY